MTNWINIKDYFQPIQPTIKPANREVSYHESKPVSQTNNFVYCFWQLKTNKNLDKDFSYRVVSDGCIDIFFDLQNPTDNAIMGFCRKYTEFPIGKSFNYIGIRFLPAAFPLLFGINAKDLSNKDQPLIKILPEFSNWIQTRIASHLSFDEIVKLLDLKLNSIIENTTIEIDPRFFDALNCIYAKKGFLDIETDLNTGLSARQLRRIFNFYIGTTPKKFSNVVRFQHILNAKPSVQSLKENRLYYDVGYYDQSHFIKHFKDFYGVTPSEAFQ